MSEPSVCRERPVRESNPLVSMGWTACSHYSGIEYQRTVSRVKSFRYCFCFQFRISVIGDVISSSVVMFIRKRWPSGETSRHIAGGRKFVSLARYTSPISRGWLHW